MCIVDPARPLAHRFRDRVFQSRGAGGDRDHFRAEKTHPVNIESLAFRIFLSHEHDAFHSEKRSRRCGRYAVLSGAGLGDEPCLSHLLCKQCLSEHVVDLMCAGVIQILPLQIDLCASEVLRHPCCVIQSGRTSGVIIKQFFQFFIECRIVLILIIGLFQLDDRIHQRFGNVLSSVLSESASWVRH